MKHKSKYDIGERAIVVLSSNVEGYLKELSKNCFLINFPKDFIDLLNENYDACINCISFSPALYFYLSNELKKDKYIIKLTRKPHKIFKKKIRFSRFNNIKCFTSSIINNMKSHFTNSIISGFKFINIHNSR